MTQVGPRPGSALSRSQSREDDDIIAITPDRAVKFSTAGNESQRALVRGTVDLGGGEAISGVLFDAFDDEREGRVVHGLYHDGLARNELVEAKEHGGTEMAVHMADDHCGPWLAWRDPTRIPPGYREVPRCREATVRLEADWNDAGAQVDPRNRHSLGTGNF